MPEEVLHYGLAHLQAAEFLYETHLFPEQEYTFTHALTHEVAYGSLLLERRRVLHARLVEALEVLYSDRLTEQVERLAHHALRGEVWDKAVLYCQQAGARAHDRAAFREAVTSFEQALQALAHLPEHDDTRVLAIELRLALGIPLNQLGEYGRHLALLVEAETLARALDDRARLGRALTRFAAVLRVTGDHDGAIAAGRQALELAAALGDSALQVQASLYLGQAYSVSGDLGRASELLRQNVETENWESSTPSTDVRIQSQAWLAVTLGTLGAFAEGRRYGEEALRLATLEGRGIHTDRCPRLPRPPVPRQRGPGARHPGARPEPGPLSCLRQPDLVPIDCSGPGLCLCAAGAPRRGACAAGGGDQGRYQHGRAGKSFPSCRVAQRGVSSGGTQ